MASKFSVDYSRFASIGDEDEERGIPFETVLSWRNSETDAIVDVRLPEDTAPAEVSVKFAVTELRVEFSYRGALQTVRLPHPRVRVAECTWTMLRRVFKGSEDRDAPCVSISLAKAVVGLWPRATFGGAGPEDAPPASEEMHGGFTWEQADERISIWLHLPPLASQDLATKSIRVQCTSTHLNLRFTLPDGRVGTYGRELRSSVKPDEMTWQFDEDDASGARRVRVDLVMQDLVDWREGPFKPLGTVP